MMTSVDLEALATVCGGFTLHRDDGKALPRDKPRYSGMLRPDNSRLSGGGSRNFWGETVPSTPRTTANDFQQAYPGHPLNQLFKAGADHAGY